MSTATILIGNVQDRLKDIPDQTVQCVVTSPPYWGLRDYGHDGQLGLELTPEAYVENMVAVFREVWRVLKDDGVLWLNLGDSYARTGGWSDNSGLDGKKRGESGRAKSNLQSGMQGQKRPTNLKEKDLVGIPWRVAFALQADGWYLRQDIIWHKPNPMPESVTDRCTKAHEYLFMLTKNGRYYFDNEAIKEPAKRVGETVKNNGASGMEHFGDGMRTRAGFARGVVVKETRNKRSVWTIATKPFKEAHFAVMPEALCEPPILASSRPEDLILDPFTGSGTVAVVALRHNRNFIGCELNPEYAKIAKQRIRDDQPMMNEVKVKAA